MNIHHFVEIGSLRAGKVTARTTTGESMSPAIRSGQRQILVPVLTLAEANSGDRR